MSNSREIILNKLRAAQRPFPDAPPRPQQFIPVMPVDDTSPQALFELFKKRLNEMSAQAFLVDGDVGATAQVLDLLKEQKVDHIIAWDFDQIPVAGLQDAISGAGIRVTFPRTHGDDRMEVLNDAKLAGAGLISADVALATTGSLVVHTAPGRGRIPTVLAQVLIAIITLDQIVPRVETWLERERAAGLPTVLSAANLCFITGPSRTGDIEMQTVLGVHGPGIVRVVVKQ